MSIFHKHQDGAHFYWGRLSHVWFFFFYGSVS